jgi:hypothetical protein
MPFPFTLTTTSSFSFSTCFESASHPSLPLTASTYRGVLRNNLKKHKRLPPQSQASNLTSIQLDTESYLPYLFALDAGLSNRPIAGDEVDIVLRTSPTPEWRPIITSSPIPGREPPRIKLNNLDHELFFTLSALGHTYTLLSRAALQPLHSSATSSPSPEARTGAIQTATKHLLSSASIFTYLVSRSEELSASAPCPDLSTAAFQALSSLALAEATLLFVLKDDPYPAAVAQERNKNDKEWMIKAPDIPKVRAHLFARLCLAASEHSSRAYSLLSHAGVGCGTGAGGRGKVDEGLLAYVEDLRKVGRGKACRFLGIDAELGGRTGEAIAWLRAGLSELGFAAKADEQSQKGLSLNKLKKDWKEKREDKKVEKGKDWGSDAGRFEEARVLEMLDAKWSKMNDTINTQTIPAFHSLLATMPSGREMHTVKPYVPPSLDAATMRSLRAPPSLDKDFAQLGMAEGVDSSVEEDGEGGARKTVVGAFPGTREEYGDRKEAPSRGYY